MAISVGTSNRAQALENGPSSDWGYLEAGLIDKVVSCLLDQIKPDTSPFNTKQVYKNVVDMRAVNRHWNTQIDNSNQLQRMPKYLTLSLSPSYQTVYYKNMFEKSFKPFPKLALAILLIANNSEEQNLILQNLRNLIATFPGGSEKQFISHLNLAAPIGTQLNDTMLTTLSNAFPNIRSLLLISAIKITTYESLKNFRKLEELTLHIFPHQTITPSVASSLTNLKKLSLRDSDCKNYNFLQHFSSLESLDVSHTDFSDLTLLENFTNLQQINLRSNRSKGLTLTKEQLLEFKSNHPEIKVLTNYDDEI